MISDTVTAQQEKVQKNHWGTITKHKNPAIHGRGASKLLKGEI
jgi:hypothetical protein